MKKILFAAVISLLIAACNDNEKKEDAASSKNAEMKALYEKNLTTVKAFIAAFEISTGQMRPNWHIHPRVIKILARSPISGSGMMITHCHARGKTGASWNQIIVKGTRYRPIGF